MKLCFATNNVNKLEEVRAVLAGYCTIIGLRDIGCFCELPEEGNTLKENALQKADYVATHYKIDCFAEDTGLEVEALNNTPGVYSARYAGTHRSNKDNMQLLLHNLAGKIHRKARFRTIIALLWQSRTYYFEGIVKGTIATEQRGNEGFGYDPVFIPEGHSRSMAEMVTDEKNQLSHRKKAVDKLWQFMEKSTCQQE